MKVSVAKIEIKTVDLTKNIVKQLDWFDPMTFNREGKEALKQSCQPVARVSLGDDNLIIFNTPNGAQSMQQGLWNQHFAQLWGDLAAVPKVILVR